MNSNNIILKKILLIFISIILIIITYHNIFINGTIENFSTIDENFIGIILLLIFSGFIKDKFSHKSVPEIINNDSLKSIKKIDEIYRISSYVCNDTLMSKLIGQVYLEKNGDFILIPLLGDQKIIFGSANSELEIKEKFDRLRVFYEEAMPFEGWDKYDEISVKYEGQIVCRKRR